MKHKTADLEGALLDLAVAKAEGATDASIENWGEGPWCVTELRAFERVPFRPSSKWDDGGPIIERERISLLESPGIWEAAVWGFVEGDELRSRLRGNGEGLTPLIAAMRAYVTARIGEFIELPG